MVDGRWSMVDGRWSKSKSKWDDAPERFSWRPASRPAELPIVAPAARRAAREARVRPPLAVRRGIGGPAVRRRRDRRRIAAQEAIHLPGRLERRAHLGAAVQAFARGRAAVRVGPALVGAVPARELREASDLPVHGRVGEAGVALARLRAGLPRRRRAAGGRADAPAAPRARDDERRGERERAGKRSRGHGFVFLSGVSSELSLRSSLRTRFGSLVRTLASLEPADSFKRWAGGTGRSCTGRHCNSRRSSCTAARRGRRRGRRRWTPTRTPTP